MTPTSTRYVLHRGRAYPVPAGGSGEGAPGAPPAEPPTQPQQPQQTPQPGGEKTFTQADLDRIAAREKDEGRRAATNEIAEQLGVSLDEAKQLIEAERQRQESEKTDAQKARDAADREKSEAEQAKQEAARERHDTRVERQLVRAGVPALDADGNEDPKFDRVKRMVSAEVGADEATIAKEVGELREQFPELFGAKANDEGQTPPPAPNGDPGPTPKRQSTDATSFDRGAERARKRLGRKPANQT